METTYASLRKAIQKGKAVLVDYNLLVYGTTDKDLIIKRTDEPFSDAIYRYMNSSGISIKKLAVITGISASTISHYFSGERAITRDYLCAICIALRLTFNQQQHLFNITKLKMPSETLFNDRVYIINDFMLGCSYNDEYTLALCNEFLKKSGERQLTAFSFETESS